MHPHPLGEREQPYARGVAPGELRQADREQHRARHGQLGGTALLARAGQQLLCAGAQFTGLLRHQLQPAVPGVGGHGRRLDLHGPRPHERVVGVQRIGLPQLRHRLPPQPEPHLGQPPEQGDLRPRPELRAEHLGRLRRLLQSRELKPALRLVDLAALQTRQDQRPAHPRRVVPAGRVGPVAGTLQDVHRRQQMPVRLLAPLGLQAQLADPAVGEHLGGRIAQRDQGVQRPAGRFQGAVHITLVLPHIAGEALGDPREQRRAGLAQLPQPRVVRRVHLGQGAQHRVEGPHQGVGLGGRKPPQGHQLPYGVRPVAHEQAQRAHHGRTAGGLDVVGPRSEVRERPRGVGGQAGEAAVVGVGGPQRGEHGGQAREGGAVVAGEGVAQSEEEIVLLDPRELPGPQRVGAEQGVVVAPAEVPRPGEEPVGDGLLLPGLRAAGRAELPHRLQHVEAHPGRGVGRLDQRLVGELFEEEQRFVAEDVFGRVLPEAAGEHRKDVQRRLRVGIEEVPAPLDDGPQGAVALRHVAAAAAQQREPVAQTPRDLGHRQHPYPGRGQLDRERQPVELTAQFLDGPLLELRVRPRGAGPLAEQLDGRDEAELGQRVHRLGGETERRPAGGEHPQLLGARHQGPYEFGGAADDVLAVVEHEQRGAGAERARDAGDETGGARQAAHRARAEHRGHLGDHVVVGGDTGQGDEVHHALLRLAPHRVGEPRLAEAAGPDDGGDPRGAQQPGEGGHVVVPAEQRIGLVQHTVTHERRLAAQQLLVYGGEFAAGVGAEFVPQGAPVGVEPGEGRGGPRGGRLAAQQLREDLLVAGQFAGEPGQGRSASARRPSRASASARDRSSPACAAERARRSAATGSCRSSPAALSTAPSHRASPASASASASSCSPAPARASLAAACSSSAELSTWSSARARR